jgi:spore maturation protein SpmB
MTEFAELILRCGRAGVELALFVLLPVMIIMLTIMRFLEQKGVLDVIARAATPLLRPLGIPGLGVFALLQLHFVSYAAPIATLTIMDRGHTSSRHIAATLAMVCAMSQANVVFPMAAVGLNALVTILISLVGGGVAAALTYHVFARHVVDDPDHDDRDANALPEHHEQGVLAVVQRAGKEALEICLGAIPMLVLALFAVNVLRSVGAIGLVEQLCAPVFAYFEISTSTILAIITKFIAGGTAMMGVMMDFLKQGIVDVNMVNRLAGFLIHPFDVAGIVVLITAGKRVAAVVRPALYGAALGILVRSILHFIVF